MKRSERNAKYPRRKRPEYPVLNVGEVRYGTRPECGVNFEFNAALIAAKGHKPTATRGQFVFSRESGARPGRSKYQPHVGNKQQKKAVA